MFGHDWQPAAGTVVDIRVKHPGSENDSRSWLVEVRCGDAEPFRAELGYPGFDIATTYNACHRPRAQTMTTGRRLGPLVSFFFYSSFYIFTNYLIDHFRYDPTATPPICDDGVT